MRAFTLPVSFRRTLWFAAGLLSASVALAQSGSTSTATEGMEKDWYKIEMIVFSQGGGSDEDEIWRTDINLDYPLNWVELLSPAELSTRIAKRAQAAAAEAEGISSIPETADSERQVQDRNGTVVGERSPHTGPAPGTTAVASPAQDDKKEAVESEAGDAEPLTPVTALEQKALLLLPSEELSLANEARRLSRSNQHRVLFHGAWLQPLEENRDQPSILISGGERFDEHHELEGSVNLYRRTYLHIETDLWLSRFATNFGQQNRPWPSLPWPPNRPPEPSFLYRIDDGGTGLWHQFNQNQDKDLSAILAQPYVVDNLVLMQQGRRMRSSELHYIDHPKMGLLIKITPYQPAGTDGEEKLPSQ
jgi:hypothetical protein